MAERENGERVFLTLHYRSVKWSQEDRRSKRITLRQLLRASIM